MTKHLEQEKVKEIVKRVADGDCEAFGELERLSRPLLVHIANYYSGLHYKFEYDDFYSICLKALYEACLEYDPRNPSFLSFAKKIMLNQCNRERKYWNASKRSIFSNKEIAIGLEQEIESKDIDIIELTTIDDEAFQNEFRKNINNIIDSIYDKDKAEILRLYIFDNLRPRDISDIKGIKYHNAYSTIQRGIEKIEKEYKDRYTLDIADCL